LQSFFFFNRVGVIKSTMSYINFSLPVSVDVAKSSRTACKWLDCKQVIAKGDLRFTVPGDYFSYYHAPCLWLSFECNRAASANQPVTSTDQIGNYESLNDPHRKVIEDLLSGETKPVVPPYIRTNSRPVRGSSEPDVSATDINADTVKRGATGDDIVSANASAPKRGRKQN